MFLALAVFLGTALSVVSVALEEMSFHRYHRSRDRDLVILLGLALVEGFGYRQITTYRRLLGLISALRRNGTWGEMERSGFASVPRGRGPPIVTSIHLESRSMSGHWLGFDTGSLRNRCSSHRLQSITPESPLTGTDTKDRVHALQC